MKKHLLVFLAIPLAMMSMQVQAEDVDKSDLVSDIALDGWTCTSSKGKFEVNTWSTEGTYDGSKMTTSFMQYWVQSGNLLKDATITKTLTGLDEGIYVFTALVRTLNEAGSTTPSGATIIANNAFEDCCAGTTCTNGTYGTYSVTGVVGSDGQLVVGFKLAFVNFNWLSFKEMTLTYKGADLDDMKAVLQTLIDKCADYDDAPMNSDISSALSTAKSEGQTACDATYTDDATARSAYSTAIAALNTALSNAHENVAAYATAADVLPQMKALTESTNVYTEEALNEYYTQWQTKYDENTLTTEEASGLQNPYADTEWHESITCDNFLMSAWDGYPDFASDYYINTWSDEVSSDASEFKTPFFEYWTWDGNTLASKTLTATMSNLAEGYYSVTALVMIKPADASATYANGVTLQVNDGTAVDVCSNNTAYNGRYVGEFKAIGQVGSDGTLEIKFIVADDSNISWLAFQNVNYATVGDPKVGDATITPAAGYVDVSDLNTVTFSFKDAESAVGEFQILNESGVTCGDQTATLSLSGTTLTATFADLAAVRGQGYTVQIAAGTVGYSDGTTTYASNEAASAEYTVALIAEGTYFFQRNGTETFLTAGGSYGTEAVVGEYGIPFTLEMTSEGTYHLRNTVSNVAAGNTKGLNGTTSFYTDYSDSECTAYSIVSGEADGIYYIMADGKYITSTALTGTYNYNYLSVTDDQTAAYEWKLISRADYDVIIAARDAAQLAAVADAADVDDVEAIASLMTSESKTSSITNPNYEASDGWTASMLNWKGGDCTFDTSNKIWEVYGSEYNVSQTISGLEEGLYKVTVNAFQRPGTYNCGINAADVFVPTSYMFANTESATNKKLLVDWSSVSDYVDNLPAVRTAVDGDASKYLNEMYVYVKNGETLTIGVNADGEIGGAGLWVAATNWTLTQYALPTVDITTTGALEEDGTTYYYATYSTPAAVDLSQCEFEAYSVTTSGTELTYTQQEDIVPAGTALVIRGTEAKTYDVAVTTSESTAIESNDLQVANGTTTGDGSTIYILANGSQGLGWYVCTDGTIINEGKCYLTIVSSNGAKFIGIGDVASGIAGVTTSQNSTSARYNLSGQRVDGSYKGIVIENGKKYLLK